MYYNDQTRIVIRGSYQTRARAHTHTRGQPIIYFFNEGLFRHYIKQASESFRSRAKVLYMQERDVLISQFSHL